MDKKYSWFIGGLVVGYWVVPMVMAKIGAQKG